MLEDRSDLNITNLLWQLNIGVDESIGEVPFTSSSIENVEKLASDQSSAQIKTTSTTIHDDFISLDKIDSLSSLQLALSTNKNYCPLQKTSPLLFAYGDTSAPIMLISLMPSVESEKNKTFWSTPEKKIWDNILTALDIKENHIYMSYAINWRPPGNLIPDLNIQKQCSDVLLKHIELVAPKFLIFLGYDIKNMLKNNLENDSLMLKNKPYPYLVVDDLLSLLKSPLLKPNFYTQMLILKNNLLNLGININ